MYRRPRQNGWQEKVAGLASLRQPQQVDVTLMNVEELEAHSAGGEAGPVERVPEALGREFLLHHEL